MKFLRLAERLLPICFWIFLIFAFDSPAFAVFTLIAAAIHELGHIAVLLAMGYPLPALSSVLDGLRITPDSPLSYKQEIALLCGGPLANIVFSAIFAPFGAFPEFSAINFMTALSNLLPLKDHDGYRIIECTALLFSKDAALPTRILGALSYVFTVLLTFLSLFLILKIGEGYWLFAVFFSVFIKDGLKIQNK